MKNTKFCQLTLQACCAVVIIGILLLSACSPAYISEIAEEPLSYEASNMGAASPEDSSPESIAQSADEAGQILPDVGDYLISDDYYDVNTDAISDAVTETVIEVAAAPVPAYLTAMNRALDWMRAVNPNPQVGSVGGEWSVIAMARAGVIDDAWFRQYLTSLNAEIAGGRIERVTDYARITLALTALGIDASNHNGQDLTAAFNTFVQAADRPSHSRTINADIFALIALDSRPYNGDRAQYIAAILAAERPGGGWGLMADATPEITAMAIQALAPHYNSNTDARAAIDRNLEWLSRQTVDDAEGYAQIIVALSALGRDARNYVDALLTFQDPQTGAFKRVGHTNMMTTEQAAYALVAYHRFVNGRNSLYDMRDAV